MRIDQQWHGYKRGHQLLASTIELTPRDQDLVDKLSDASGSPKPGERFDPYLTIYPLPSGRFNVVARTWQDLSAPRSGTVFTRSLLVPSDYWRGASELRQFLVALESREITDHPADISEQTATWPPVRSPGLSALVEALFLEKATAVAAFGFAETELIGGRLVEALWAGKRSTFALCTHAMGPRSLPDRDFDLVFAPESSRSRFAKWAGRKLSSSNSGEPAARHEWTVQIQSRVFEDAHPSLRDLDEIGALDSNGRADGSALRLALRWSELEKKASDTPTSIIGMLDILTSLGRDPWSVPSLGPLIVETLGRATAMPTQEAWQFLQLLVKKLSTDLPLSVLRAIFKATERLTTSAPYVVLNEDAGPSKTPMPHLLRPAVAKGLADLEAFELSPYLRTIDPTLCISLMAESPLFARSLTTALSIDPEASLISRLSAAASSDERAARRMAVGVSKGAASSEVTPLVRVALVNSPRGNFSQLAENVLKAGGSSRDELIDALVEFSRELMEQEWLRRAAITAPQRLEGDRILLHLVRDRDSVAWLIDTLSNENQRLLPLLLGLIQRWSDQELGAIAREGRNRDALFEAALSGLPLSGKAFVRLLRVSAPNAATAATLIRTASPRLQASELREALLATMEPLFTLDPETNGDLIDHLLSLGDPVRVINAATSTAIDGARVGRNIAAMARSKSSIRFVPVVDHLSRRLIERRAGGFGQAGYDAWAQLLRAARQMNPEALIRSADGALDYSLARIKEPAGSVVAASFPIVHARLKKNSLPDVPLNLITAIFLLPVVLFSDWDRSKAARHGLVETFLRSNWDPVELLRAGVDAEIPQKILGYLAAQPGGREYLQRIEIRVPQLPEPVRGRLSTALSSFRSKGE